MAYEQEENEMTLQNEIMKTLHVQPVIDPKEEIRKRIDFLKDYLRKTGAKGFVLELAVDRILH